MYSKIRKHSPPKTSHDRLIAATASITALSFVISWILVSYFKMDFSALLVFHGDDSHCLRGTESLGVHCFGDFSSTRINSFTSPPIGAEAVYPASTRIVRYPFQVLENLFGFQVSLAAYLACSAGALLSPFVDRSRFKYKIPEVVLLGIITLPFVSTLDRGNTIAFAVPGVYLYLVGVKTQSEKMTLLGIALAVAVKPQLLLLNLIGLRALPTRIFIKCVALSAAVVTLPFLIFGRKSIETLFSWIRISLEWSQSSKELQYPSNLSFGRFFNAVGLPELFAVGVIAAVIAVILLEKMFPHCVDTTTSPEWAFALNVSALLGCLIMGLPTSYPYNTALIVPVIPFLSGSAPALLKARPERLVRNALIACITILLSPLVLVNIYEVGVLPSQDGAFNLISNVQPAFWLFFLAMFVVFKASLIWRGRCSILR